MTGQAATHQGGRLLAWPQRVLTASNDCHDRFSVSACSSAAAERNFTAHKFVHSHLRNSPKADNGEKLVFTFFNAKNFDTTDVATFDHVKDFMAHDTDVDSNNQDTDFDNCFGFILFCTGQKTT
jgi:hypothetical protein